MNGAQRSPMNEEEAPGRNDQDEHQLRCSISTRTGGKVGAVDDAAHTGGVAATSCALRRTSVVAAQRPVLVAPSVENSGGLWRTPSTASGISSSCTSLQCDKENSVSLGDSTGDLVKEQNVKPEELTMAGCAPPRLQVRWIIDGILLISVAALLLLIETGFVPSLQIGFYCEDPNIAYTYEGDTISITCLLVVSFLAPPVAMWLVELGCRHCSEDDRAVLGLGARARRGLRHAWLWYREYLLGLILILLMVDIAKVIVGEPRPHFLDSCKPDVMSSLENCKAVATRTGYIATYTCTNTERTRVKDSTRSFPSGHAALAVYSALFLIYYLQRRMPGVPTKAPSQYLRPWLQCICATWAIACAFTRISDHRHHPHDVLAGTVLGVVFAFITIRYFCGGFWPGYCAEMLRTQQQETGAGLERGHAVKLMENVESRHNGHVLTGPGGQRTTHQSTRRLLSSTSSYSGSIAADDVNNLRDATPS